MNEGLNFDGKNKNTQETVMSALHRSSATRFVKRYTVLASLIVCLLPVAVSAQTNRFDESRLERIDEVLIGR